MKNVIKIVVLSFLLVGCGSRAANEFDIEEFARLVDSEFVEVNRVEIVDDELMSEPGYYLEKVLFYDEYGSTLFNVEYFDNETDQLNRSDYVKSIANKSIDMLYNDLEFVSGGEGNRENLS